MTRIETHHRATSLIAMWAHCQNCWCFCFANWAVARKVQPSWQQLRTGNIIREKKILKMNSEKNIFGRSKKLTYLFTRNVPYLLCTELYFQLALTLNMCFLRPQDINVTEQHLHKRPWHVYQDPVLLPIEEEKFCRLPSIDDSKENKLWHLISKRSLSLGM